MLDVSESKGLSLKQAIFRDIFYLLLEMIGLIYFLFLIIHEAETESIYDDYKNFADQLAFWWMIIELVSMLTNYKRRAVHDFIAKSVVVRVQKIN